MKSVITNGLWNRVIRRIKRIKEMNDLDLFYLKFKKRYSTQTLLRRFPAERKRIVEIALVDVNEQLLEKIIQEKEVLSRVHLLKKKFQQIKDESRPVLVHAFVRKEENKS